MTRCKTIKSRFKIGDEVRIIKPHAHKSNFLNTTFIITSRDSDWDEEPSWYGAGQPYRYKESQLELAHPPKSTRFEVGKKYRRINGVTIYEIIHLGETRVFYHTDHNQEGCISKSLFHKFVEYIPPPPEEWRIVYKNSFGDITVGKIPFKSESEAKASSFWTDHSDQDAFKTIRVDA